MTNKGVGALCVLYAIIILGMILLIALNAGGA